jgi:cell division protein FtsA
MRAKQKHLKNLFALDLGTTKFCLATMREAPGGGQRLETVAVPAEGMRRGMLANLDEAKTGLNKLLEVAERQFGCDVTRVVVGVAGSHLQSRIVTATLPLETGIVTAKDTQRLIEKIEGDYTSETRELLHTVPIGYRVDSRETIDDPIGFKGRVVHGDYFLIDADKYYLKDIVDVCNDSGLQVVRLYSEPFASASVTVPDSYKELGVALGDIGGGTTDGIVFQAGRPRYAFTVNVAGKLMTSDLAIGLNIPPEEAERVKIFFGIKARGHDVNAMSSTLEVRDIRGQRKIVGLQHVQPILGARVHELGALLTKELMQFRGGLGAGLMLTGGGANVQGMHEYFQKRMGIPVRKAQPILKAEEPVADNPEGGDNRDPGPVSALQNPENQTVQHAHPTKFATVIGLLNLELCRGANEDKQRKISWTGRYLGNFMNWIKELS